LRSADVNAQGGFYGMHCSSITSRHEAIVKLLLEKVQMSMHREDFMGMHCRQHQKKGMSNCELLLERVQMSCTGGSMEMHCRQHHLEGMRQL